MEIYITTRNLNNITVEKKLNSDASVQNSFVEMIVDWYLSKLIF